MTAQLILTRGGVTLGEVEHVEDDFPQHLGRFRAFPAFFAVAELFRRERELLAKGELEQWEKVRAEIIRPGLVLESTDGKQRWTNPTLHIEDDSVWWR